MDRNHVRLQLPQAAPVLGDDDDADDAVGYGFAVPPHLLQALPRFRIDLHLPLAVSQAPHGLLERELGRHQCPALVGDFDFRHRSRMFARRCWPRGLLSRAPERSAS